MACNEKSLSKRKDELYVTDSLVYVLKESERLIDWSVRDFTVVRFVFFSVLRHACLPQLNI